MTNLLEQKIPGMFFWHVFFSHFGGVESCRASKPALSLPPMDFDQGQFDFDSPPQNSGYRKWRQELTQRRQKFESRYGIILGSKVRLTLIGENLPLEGIITVCESREPKIRSKLHLRIGSREFIHAQIEAISRLPHESRD
ncbi:MAG: hypothetical protein ACJAVK_002911 [Akkermansiaceae bacterium]|jgi:hypothetical protein